MKVFEYVLPLFSTIFICAKLSGNINNTFKKHSEQAERKQIVFLVDLLLIFFGIKIVLIIRDFMNRIMNDIVNAVPFFEVALPKVRNIKKERINLFGIVKIICRIPAHYHYVGSMDGIAALTEEHFLPNRVAFFRHHAPRSYSDRIKNSLLTEKLL